MTEPTEASNPKPGRGRGARGRRAGDTPSEPAAGENANRPLSPRAAPRARRVVKKGGPAESTPNAATDENNESTNEPTPRPTVGHPRQPVARGKKPIRKPADGNESNPTEKKEDEPNPSEPQRASTPSAAPPRRGNRGAARGKGPIKKPAESSQDNSTPKTSDDFPALPDVPSSARLRSATPRAKRAIRTPLNAQSKQPSEEAEANSTEESLPNVAAAPLSARGPGARRGGGGPRGGGRGGGRGGRGGKPASKGANPDSDETPKAKIGNTAPEDAAPIVSNARLTPGRAGTPRARRVVRKANNDESTPAENNEESTNNTTGQISIKVEMPRSARTQSVPRRGGAPRGKRGGRQAPQGEAKAAEEDVPKPAEDDATKSPEDGETKPSGEIDISVTPKTSVNPPLSDDIFPIVTEAPASARIAPPKSQFLVQKMQNQQPLDLDSNKNAIILPSGGESQITLTPKAHVHGRIDVSSLVHYNLVREKRAFGNVHFTLIFNDAPILYSRTSKDERGKIHIISSKPKPQIHADGYAGFIRVHQNGTRFTLVSSEGNAIGQIDGEILGLAFIKENESLKEARQMRIILEKDLHPYYPVNKDFGLSKLALTNSPPDNAERFHTMCTRLPRRCGDGTLSLSFGGNALVIPSVKNFLINYPDDSKCIYQVFKHSNDAFSVRFAPPFSPLSAFTIAIAALCGK